MKITEADVSKDIVKYAEANPDMQLWRNNVGAVKKGLRWIVFGLCKGSSDRIGYTKVKITPGMVGKTIAVFTAVEIKRPGGITTDLQEEFVADIEASGGIGMIADSVEVVVKRVKGYLLKMKRRVK